MITPCTCGWVIKQNKNMNKKFCVLQKKVLSFGPNRTVEVRTNSSAKPNTMNAECNRLFLYLSLFWTTKFRGAKAHPFNGASVLYAHMCRRDCNWCKKQGRDISTTRQRESDQRVHSTHENDGHDAKIIPIWVNLAFESWGELFCVVSWLSLC